MNLYIAGKMTYVPQYNFPAFDACAARLTAIGHKVTSPAELDSPEDRARAMASPDGAPQTAHQFGKTWGDFLARDVKLLADDGIEAIVVLPDWETSRGARLETFVGAALCGMAVYEEVWQDGVVVGLSAVHPVRLFRAWCADDSLVVETEAYAR